MKVLRRKVVLVPILLALSAGAAFAAWAIYTGISGMMNNGTVANAPNAPALTFSDNGTNTAATPCDTGGTTGACTTGGTEGVIGYKITNNDSSASHAWVPGSPVWGFASNPANCSTNFHIATDSPAPITTAIPPGQSVTGTMKVVIDSGELLSCAGVTFKVIPTGSSNP